MTRLFAYGTLRDPEYQAALFGHALPMQPATLPGWMPVFTDSGYLTIVPAPGDAVTGALIALDDDELFVADAWEEVPLYVRTLTSVSVAGETHAAWVYVRPSDSRERAPDGVLARHRRAAILEAIRASSRATSRDSHQAR